MGRTKLTPSQLNAGAQAAYVAAGETTTSSSYTDLATVTDTVTVTIGASGAALVSINCNAGNASTGGYVYMSFAASGTSPISAGTYYAANQEPGASASSFYTTSAVFLVTGLNPGTYTFKAKYKVTAGTTGTFLERRIAVLPI